ncbi:MULTISPECIES: patatin-like phospholipase family protein [unclassified Duganella]|uniref:patatin-like phospholipase family protein n=1 Tax=unclassified Duganella TaxID=2636909 RepID=UPI0006FA0A23|nr:MULTISPECIES: patatin-like phospholipase family protein [unclassified Duganella]KQV55530.1 patatin domain-containing protein [Duganella sp. Root336D2]KRC02595.1 patatin domain-containing protein [Duganella sp. Root198D2]
MKRLVFLLALCTGFACAAENRPAAAAPAGQNPGPDPASPVSKRPKVALVLSGGGARGFAHVGVLRALQQMHIPVDIVVGTSMGSVIGGAWAAGASLKDLETMAATTDWDSVVADRPARDELHFRRRDEDIQIPSRIEFGITRHGVLGPPGAASNAALEMALQRLLPRGTRDLPVSQLPLPFRSVASDLLSGELVVLDNTPLFQTIRASLAVPGVFAPVRIKDHLVVDGGLVRNLPVDMARAMGAEIVIAVNVGTTLAPEKELGSALGVANQMLQILTEQNVQRSLSELRKDDILIAPRLEGITFLDFSTWDKAMAAGEAAARELAPRLAALALPERDYISLESLRLATPVDSDRPVKLAKVQVQGAREVNPEVLEKQSGLEPGKPTTREQVRQAAVALYGRGDMARVETDIDDVDGERTVTIRTTEAEWARSRMRVGLELASDFRDSNNFAIKVMHVLSALNSWGGELRTEGRLGNERGIGVQWWQPLGPGSQWFLMPAAQVGRIGGDIFEKERRMARVSYSARTASTALGRQFGNWGELSVGVQRQAYSVRQLIPQDAGLPVNRVYNTKTFARFRVDTLDSLAFPTRGTLITIGREQTPGSGKSVGTAGTNWGAAALQAFRIDDWAGHVSVEWAKAQAGASPVTLGGFLRLSGTPADSIQEPTILLGRVVLARRVAALPSAFGGNMRAGFSLETGGGFDRGTSASGRALKQAGSAFLSVETRFGPLFLGAGATRDGEQTLYLFLGPIW